MCDEVSNCLTRANCLTRVVDDQCAMQVTCVQDVVQKIQASLTHIPSSHRHYIANALLNVAVGRMLKEQGNAHTSTQL
jgi:hypothetical protein